MQTFSGNEIRQVPNPKSGPLLRRLVHLDQVAAGIGKNRKLHRPLLPRVRRELDTVLLQSICLGFDIVHLKCGERDSLLKHRFLKNFPGRVGIRFKHQLHIRVTIRRNNREPPEFPTGMSLDFLKPRTSV